jgi:hypothetical protein
MDTLTIVIQLTGLLMIVPPNGPGGPTHVLMPEPDHVRHEAYIGFRRTPGAQHCEEDLSSEFRFVRMEGWVLDPLPGSGGAAAELPRTILNVTRGSGGRPVRPDHLVANPRRNPLRSRVTFGGGNVTDTCQMGRWRFDPVGRARRDTISLSNVVEWTIPDVPQGSIVLKRRPLGGGSEQELATLYPDGAGRVELLVAHVPSRAWNQFQRTLLRLSAFDQTRIGTLATEGSQTGDGSQVDDTDRRISHFRSYYKLLDRVRTQRLPSDPRVLLPRGCPLMIWFPRELGVAAPTTVNCMVTSGSQ